MLERCGETFFMRVYNFFQQGLTFFQVADIVSGAVIIFVVGETSIYNGGENVFREVLKFVQMVEIVSQVFREQLKFFVKIF